MTVDAKQPSESPPSETAEQSLSLDQLIEKKRYYALKSLLLAEEYERLKNLEDSINHPGNHAKKIAPSLPAAILQSNLESVYQALQLNTLVHDKIIDSVQNDTQLYTDALYPVIFPAIKKSIAEAFKEMMQSLNHMIEQSMSLNRLSWHFEAWRSGVSYREVVLRHTLAYRVEQVFLIHRETGLLMRHVASEGVEQLRDSDAVSAMLTALQDFIKDSFSVDENDQLDTVEIGSYTVFLTRNVNAVLACVTQGIAPYSLRDTFSQALQTLNKNYHSLLKNFEGDSDALEPTDPVLQSCLVSEAKNNFKKNNSSIKNFVIVLLLILIALSYWRYDVWKFEQRSESYMTALQGTLSVVITHHYYQGKHLFIEGLYDPSSQSPQQLGKLFGLNNHNLTGHWQTYLSLEPFFVERRAAQLLHPPAFVKLRVKKNTLVVSGATDEQWLEKLSLFTPTVLGLEGIDKQNLKTYQQLIIERLQPPSTVMMTFKNSHLVLQGNAPLAWERTVLTKLASLNFVRSYNIKNLLIDEELRFQELVTKLEELSIYFPNEKAIPKNTETDYFQYMTKIIRKLQQLSEQLNKPIELVVTGYTDSIGTTQFNQNLAEKRSEYIIGQLRQQGVSIGLKKAISTSGNKKTPDDSERKISLKVIFSGIKKP